MRRAFLIMPDTVRIAAGMSLGPIAISATAPISRISDQAKSNMGARVSPGRLEQIAGGPKGPEA